ncbi:MAG: ParB/RepB/Spo0J family partition protein [Kofleriaceae bacterium]|nr:ParB/RepB/Spo0J family partition protein [Kofleriaceae bacterium]
MSDAKKPRGLGRGLGALLPSQPAAAPAAAPAPAAVEPARPRTYFHAQIEDVHPSPDQPRRRFDDAELDELATSIRAHGVIMPLVVRPRPGGGYHLIAGERRWRASQRAGLHEVPVVVQDVDDRAAFERALVENLQRADLNAIEEASAFHRLIDEFGLTQEQVAERVGKDRSTVANSVRLLRLPPSVRQLVEERRLSMGHARALLGLPEGADVEVAARTVMAKGLSVRATEALVRKHGQPAAAPRPTATPAKSASVRDLEDRLTRALGGPVTIDEDQPGAEGPGAKRSGTIEIRYHDLDHLDRLLDRLL